jgi:hypothetical protein
MLPSPLRVVVAATALIRSIPLANRHQSRMLRGVNEVQAND